MERLIRGIVFRGYLLEGNDSTSNPSPQKAM